MPDFKAKSPNSILAAASPQISLGELAEQRSPDLLTEFNGPTSKGFEEKRWEIAELQGRRREERGMDPQRLVHTP